ncbi:hypothetical protein AOLI_G00190970 [Acnodon oligacanthus]
MPPRSGGCRFISRTGSSRHSGGGTHRVKGTWHARKPRGHNPRTRGEGIPVFPPGAQGSGQEGLVNGFKEIGINVELGSLLVPTPVWSPFLTCVLDLGRVQISQAASQSKAFWPVFTPALGFLPTPYVVYSTDASTALLSAVPRTKQAEAPAVIRALCCEERSKIRYKSRV